jgi:hypothetical protein
LLPGFFFYRWICVWSVGIDVLGLTETRISCQYRRRRQDRISNTSGRRFKSIQDSRLLIQIFLAPSFHWQSDGDLHWNRLEWVYPCLLLACLLRLGYS